MSSFFDDIFSKYQYGFRKGFSTQQCLLVLLEKWKRSIDRGKVFVAILTDLSKVFEYLDHDLLIAKLNAYGFSLPALRLIRDYLSDRKQRKNKQFIQYMDRNCFWGTSRINTWSPFVQHFPCRFVLQCK